MKTLWTFGAVVGLLGASGAVPTYAVDDWGSLGIVSGTVGVTTSRLCMGAPGAGRPADFGCPSYTPSVTTAGDVSVTGNLSAAKFIGDGSGLTGIGGSSDRITSGTSSVTINSATSTISFTTAGGQRMTINASGNVGIGTTSPSYPLDIQGTGPQMQIGSGTGTNAGWIIGYGLSSQQSSIWATGNGGTASTPVLNAYANVSQLSSGRDIYLNAGGNGGRVYLIAGSQSTNATVPALDITQTWNNINPVQNGIRLNITNTASAAGSKLIDLQTGGVSQFNVLATGNVGIGTTAPTKTLDVSGTAHVSSAVNIDSNTTVSGTIKVAGTGSETCTSANYGTIRFNASTGGYEFCRP